MAEPKIKPYDYDGSGRSVVTVYTRDQVEEAVDAAFKHVLREVGKPSDFDTREEKRVFIERLLGPPEK